jgi:hypothetical protein
VKARYHDNLYIPRQIHAHAHQHTQRQTKKFTCLW